MMKQAEFFHILSNLDSEDPFEDGIHYLNILMVDKLKEGSIEYENKAINYQEVRMENIKIFNYDKSYKMFNFYFKFNHEHYVVSVTDDSIYSFTQAIRASSLEEIIKLRNIFMHLVSMKTC